MSAQEKVKMALNEIGGFGTLTQITQRLIQDKILEEGAMSSNTYMRLVRLQKWGEVKKDGKVWRLVQE